MATKIAWALPGLLLITGAVACSSEAPPADQTTTAGTGGTAVVDDDDTTVTASASTGGGGDPGTGGNGPSSSSSGAGGDPEPPPDCTPGGPICTQEPPGQAQVDARMHSCQMVRYDTLGRILADFGVQITAGGASPGNSTPAAGTLYANVSAQDAFGVAKEQGRVGDKDFHTTASALKLFDIFVQAAPVIIAQMPTRPHCMKNGVGTAMFDANNSCNPDAITCLLGYPATDDHTLLCDLIIDKADAGNAMDVNKKKTIAVATLLAAAHTCE